MTRQALKADFKVDAAKRDIAGIKFQKWEAGKPVGKLSLNLIIEARFFNHFAHNRQEAISFKMGGKLREV